MIAGQGKNTNTILDKMSLREKISQMIFHAVTPSFLNKESHYYKHLKYLISDLKIGGIHVFAAPTLETAYLLNKFQEWAEIPLLVSADMERGAGGIIKNEIYFGNNYFIYTPSYITGGGVHFPPLMAVGATGSEEYSYQMGKITAAEAKCVGIYFNFAPVLDINNNPDNPIVNTRSFGEDIELVKKLGTAYIKGVQDEGVLATAKHFPGHGDTETDSHIDLAVLKYDMTRLENIEFKPFIEAVKTVKAVMSAHVALPEITGTDLPATLSEEILTGILRNKMNFKGLIVTDAMVMGGIINKYNSETAAPMAVKAGADILLLLKDPEKAVQGILDAVKKGDIIETRINESVKRILEAKQWTGLFKNKFSNIENIENILGKPEHFKTAQNIAEKSITLLKNDNNILPLDKDKEYCLIKITDQYQPDYGRNFKDELSKHIKINKSYTIWEKTSDKELDDINKELPKETVLICPVFIYIGSFKGKINIPEKIVEFLNKLKSKNSKIVIISFGSPYIYREIPFINAYICGYYGTYEIEIAAAQILSGKLSPDGKLPISIPGHFKIGDGLKY